MSATNLDVLNSLESSIAQFENVNTDYNNPGGISYETPTAQAYGAIGESSTGVAIFPDEQTGQDAFDSSLENYINAGVTPAQLINNWSGNPNEESFVTQQTGLSPNEPINQQSPYGPTGATSPLAPLANIFAKGLGLQSPSGGSVTGSSSLVARGAAILLGLLLIGAGLFSFRGTQDIIVSAGKKAAEAVAA